MKLIVVHSLKGGTGRTTVACNLAAHLLLAGHRCAVLDADPKNGVGLHLGMQLGERFGFWRPEFSEAEYAAYHRRNPSKVPHVPFGFCTWSELREIERLRQADPDWLSSRVGSFTPPDAEIVLLDLPAGLSPWMEWAYRAAATVLQVVSPDGPSFATLPQLAAAVHEFEGPTTMAYLINGMDARKSLSRDVQEAMASLLGEQLLPVTIPVDEALREAFAQQRTINDHAPESQSARVFRSLAAWTVERVVLSR